MKTIKTAGPEVRQVSILKPWQNARFFIDLFDYTRGGRGDQGRSGMELRQLRYFVAVGERLNFSKAARSVHVTQSTISHQIKQLEHELDYKLFERSLHHVRLTEQGEALLPGVVRILKELDEIIQLSKAGHAPLQEHLRIIVGAYVVIAAIPAALRRFNALCPHVSIKIDETFSNLLLNRFEHDDYDLAVGVEEPGAPFASSPLCQEELVLVVPAHHAMAGRKRIRMIELHGKPLALPSYYRRQIDRCFESAGAKPLVVAEFDNPNTLVAAVAEQGLSGIVVHTLPEWLQGKGLVRVHLEDPTPTRNIVLYWRDQSLSPALKILLETIGEQVREISRQQNDLGLHPYKNSEQAASLPQIRRSS